MKGTAEESQLLHNLEQLSKSPQARERSLSDEAAGSHPQFGSGDQSAFKKVPKTNVLPTQSGIPQMSKENISHQAPQ